MMKTDLLGKRCRDLVSGNEGVVMAVIEWQTGCDQYALQGKGIYGSNYCFREQLEIIDEDRIAGDPPEYVVMQDFGKRCYDKYTDFEGVIVGRMILYLAAEQYAVLPEELHDGRIVQYEWLDKLRVVVKERRVQTPEVTGPRYGCILPKSYQ